MALDVKSLPDDKLENLIANHKRQGATSAPLFLEALSEQQRRGSFGLDIETTVKALTQAARQRRFVSYGDIADANGAKFSKVRFRMNRHLDDVLAYCHQHELPYLTAIVVPKSNVKDGQQTASTLQGFIAGLEKLAVTTPDHQGFMEREQERAFDWARTQPEGPAS